MQKKRIKQRRNSKGNRQNKKNNYKINNKLFIAGFIILLLSLCGLIYIEGFSVLKRTFEIHCPVEALVPCETEFENGTIITTPIGGTYYINKHDTELIPLLNKIAPIMLILTFVINHLLYNRSYKFTADKLKAAAKNEIKFWLKPIIWLAGGLEAVENKFTKKKKKK